jgi:hypothetical protein
LHRKVRVEACINQARRIPLPIECREQSSDCGFSSQATNATEVHPTVVWAKFDAMRDGAGLASRQLW